MNLKIITLLILILLFTIFVSQNTESVPISFLAWQWELPKIILITVTGLLGVVIGLITSNLLAKKEKKVSENNNSPASDNRDDEKNE
ncbi:MAG: hypothetical protein Kow0098_07620 [Ignavibacteriaceae bacterium]